MHPTLHLICPQPDRLLVRLDVHGVMVEGQHDLPPPDLLADLFVQVAAGQVRGVATGTLAAVLGTLLFAGEAGEALRRMWQEDPEASLLLRADPAVQHWPWELARDPVTGRWPVADGAGLIRVGGGPASHGPFAPRAVLVVPAEAGVARRDALAAAARQLQRKAGLALLTADPATGPALREALAAGAALVHLDVESRGGEVALDDGRVPTTRLGLDSGTWLAVLGGAETTKDAALTLRDLGVAVVIGRQIEISQAEAGAVDREIYRALATGATPVEAVRRARQSLLRLGGAEAGLWAAPVLRSAPAETADGFVPAASAFPPPLRAQGAVDLGPPAAEAGAHDPFAASPGTGGGLPVPAPVFIQRTVQLLGAAQPGQVDPALAARAETLRALGSLATAAADPEDENLGPAERLDRLVDKLVDGIGRPDLPLAAPRDLSARVDRAAHSSAVSRFDAERAARALLCSTIVWFESPATECAARLAQHLTEGVFVRHALRARATGATPLCGVPTAEGGTGWLTRAAALNWRRDEIDAFNPSSAPPRTRMPLVSPAPNGGFLLQGGAWLIIEDADLAPAADRAALFDALARGAIEGLDADGRPWHLPCPADFRVLMVGAAAPQGLPGWVPVVRVTCGLASAEVDTTLAGVERRLGPPADGQRAAQRQRLVRDAVAIVRLLRTLAPLPTDLGAGLTAHAALALEAHAHPDSPEAHAQSLDEAATLYLGHRLSHWPLPLRRVADAWLAGQPSRVLGLAVEWQTAQTEDDLLYRLGRLLDADHPVADPRVSTRAALSQLDAGRLVMKVGSWTGWGGLASPVALPGLRAALTLSD